MGTHNILGQSATLFKDGPKPIFLLADGRFAVESGGRWKAFNTLRAAEKVVTVAKPSVRLFDSGCPADPPIDVVEIARPWVIDASDKRHRFNYRLCLYDPKIAARLKELDDRHEAAEAKYRAERDKLVDKLTGVGPGNFADIVAAHGTRPGS